MKFSIKDFLSKCDQIRSFLQIWSLLLKKSLMENFIFCAVGWVVGLEGRSSGLQIFFKVGILRNFANFTGKNLWSHFLIKLQALTPTSLLKRASSAGVFLWILRNFLEHLFLQKISGGCFCRRASAYLEFG